MTSPLIDQITHALLYEGFVLYPYRSSVKNRQRWTFGGLFPESSREVQAETEAAGMQTQCLVEGDHSTTLRCTVRFLHPLDRLVGRLQHPLSEWPADTDCIPPFELVESLSVGDREMTRWQEAVERTVTLPEASLGELLSGKQSLEFDFPAGRQLEPLCEPGGPFVGVVIRDQQPVSGRIELCAVAVGERLFRITLKTRNCSDVAQSAQKTREQTLLQAFVSTHAVLHVSAGNFLSLTDHPAECAAAVSECVNLNTWPVLVGEQGERHTLLSAPMILYDYPQIAPESPGDLFDGTEIDEILTLRILTLTESEKQAMAGLDERTRALLERTESLLPEQLRELHGGMRNVPSANSPATSEPDPMHAWNPWDDRPAVSSVIVDGMELRPGDRVRLHPRGRADIFDMALDGKTACIESIEQDFEEQIHLAVSVDDDPGRDFGRQRLPAHRFFFRLEEVEPLPKAALDQ